MSTEDPFRIALATVLTATLLVVGYHRLQAAASGERIYRAGEGLLLGMLLRLAGMCLWAGTLAYLLNPPVMQWSALPLPEWLRWLGAPVGLAGCYLIYWTLTSLGNNLTDTVMVRSDATLVTGGAYRWMRHPMYLSTAILLVADTLLSANGFIGLSGLATMALLAARTPLEEQKLVERFGDVYRAYMATTNRYLPTARSRRGSAK